MNLSARLRTWIVACYLTIFAVKIYTDRLQTVIVTIKVKQKSDLPIILYNMVRIRYFPMKSCYLF